MKLLHDTDRATRVNQNSKVVAERINNELKLTDDNSPEVHETTSFCHIVIKILIAAALTKSLIL